MCSPSGTRRADTLRPTLLALLLALALCEPAGSAAHASVDEAVEVSDAVLMLEAEPEAGFDGGACMDATEAHGGGLGLVFERRALGPTSALSQALLHSRSKPTLAVFWFEARADVVAIYLYAPQSHAVYVREVARSSEAAMVEAVGLITASTAGALRSGETLAMRKISEQEWAALQAEPKPTGPVEPPLTDPGPEPEVPPESEPVLEAPRELLKLELGVGYRGASFNNQAPWQHGVAGRFAALLGDGVLVEVGYAWMAPVNIGGVAELKLTRHEPEVAAGWRWTLGTRSELDALGLGALELNRWRAGTRSGTRVRGRVGGAFRAAVEVGAGVFLEARFGARVALNRFDFVVCESPDAACSGDAREVVASGWRVAPEASVGVSYRFGVSAKK